MADILRLQVGKLEVDLLKSPIIFANTYNENLMWK